MKFKIMGKKGDAEFDYETIEMQKIKFDELQTAGMLPMVKTGSKTKMLKEFDPGVDEVIWIPKIMGG
jgi:hypothetical protein